WPGKFLTGQPRFAGDNQALPPELGNGSFLVFRRLRQDVKAFNSDTVAMAQQLTATTGRPVSEEDLRASLVGRHRNGNALMRDPKDPAKAEGPNEINYFVYGTPLPALELSDGTQVSASFADPDPSHGRRCPVWGHVRKVNPRDLGTNKGGSLETL